MRVWSTQLSFHSWSSFLALILFIFISSPLFPLAEELFELEKETELAKGTNGMKSGAGRVAVWSKALLGEAMAQGVGLAGGGRETGQFNLALSRVQLDFILLPSGGHSPPQVRLHPCGHSQERLSGQAQAQVDTLLPPSLTPLPATPHHPLEFRG